MEFNRLNGGAHLDLSRVHPMNHGLRECQHYYGGKAQHLRLFWEFTVYPLIRTKTFCVLDRHRWGLGFEVRHGVACPFYMCVDCWARHPETPHADG